MEDRDLLERLLEQNAALLAELKARAAPAQIRTVRDLKDRWAKAKSRLASFACDDARAEKVLAWAPADGPFAGVPIADRDPMSLTGEDPDAYRVWRYSTVTRRKGPPKPATVNRELMALLRILNFAAKRRTIQHNPLRGIESEDEDNAREVVVEEDGFAAIVHALGDNVLMVALVTLAYDSGMRKTELLCCRRSWLDDLRGRVHIPGAVAKNGEPRVTDLSARAWAAIGAMPRVLGTDLLFANPETKEPYDGRWIHELFVRAVESSGVTGRDGTPPRLHDLRRSWITLARRRGIKESVIMAKSGHKDHKVFRRYSIVEDSDLADSAATMEAGRARDLAALAERRGPRKVGSGIFPNDATEQSVKKR